MREQRHDEELDRVEREARHWRDDTGEKMAPPKTLPGLVSTKSTSGYFAIHNEGIIGVEGPCTWREAAERFVDGIVLIKDASDLVIRLLRDRSSDLQLRER